MRPRIPQIKEQALRIGQSEETTEHKVVFSFERIQAGKYCFTKLRSQCKADISDAIYDRRAFTWKVLQLSGKARLGTEKIPISSLRVDMPDFITPDAKHVLAIRYGPNNSKKRILGYIVEHVFFVLWIDSTGEMYEH